LDHRIDIDIDSLGNIEMLVYRNQISDAYCAGFQCFFLPSFTAIPAVYYIFQVSLLFYWALLGFTGFYWVSKVFFTEFYCDSGGLSRFSGFTIVLLGFYWVLTIL